MAALENRLWLSGDDWKCKGFLAEDWVWRNAEKQSTRDVRFWRPAIVPGCPTADLLRIGEISDPFFEKNSLSAEWIPQRTWIYRKEFLLPKEWKEKELILHFDGVDYDASFYLNDILLGEHHSMFTPAEFVITSLVKQDGPNLLAVVLNHAPMEQPQVSKTRYVKTHKSRMTYWWDFCPRMIHMGIWDNVWIDARSSVKVNQPDVGTRLTEDFSKADITVNFSYEKLKQEGASHFLVSLMYQGEALEEKTVEGQAGTAACCFSVDKPALWWPHGYGKQPLYTIQVASVEGTAAEIQSQVRFGIRTVRFTANETTDPTARPYTVCVNGQKIYIKGYNWVPVNVFYGLANHEKRNRLIELALHAGINMFRVWGGGLIEKESFYNLCDEYGILVWQEFIQSSSGIENKPSEEPEFLAMMEQEASCIIPRKKHHPSLIVWGGGNELEGKKKDTIIDESEPVIHVLAECVRKYDPSRYFLESSPTGRLFNNTLENIAADPTGLHDVHGPWEYQGLKEQYALYNAGTSLLSSEFGVEGMANLDVLRRYHKEEHLWPADRENPYYFHRGHWWNHYAMMQKCFAEQVDCIEQAVKASQFLQYEGLRYAVEANRRRFPVCSGTFPWQFHEPFPNNYCTSVVDYHGAAKPAYYGIRKAYSTIAVTAAFDGQSQADKERFEAALYLQCDPGRLPDLKGAVVCAEILDHKGACVEKYQQLIPDTQETRLALIQGRAISAGSIGCQLADCRTTIFYLRLTLQIGNNVVSDNCYYLTKTDLSPFLKLEKTSLDWKWIVEDEKRALWMKNTGSTAAAGVWIREREERIEVASMCCSDNYLCLMPGEEKIIELDARKETELILEGWNLSEMSLKIE